MKVRNLASSVTFSLYPSDLDLIEELAERWKVGRSEVVRQLVRGAFKPDDPVVVQLDLEAACQHLATQMIAEGRRCKTCHQIKGVDNVWRKP